MNCVLGVCGSVASYRAADLARELMRAGFTVRVCLTDAASKFVSPALFEALTGQPCLQDVFEEPERGRMAHIDWARQADVLVVAPATASTLARLAHGIGEDMLTTLALAFEGPLVLAPAMNPSMYAHSATQEALRVLRSRAAAIVEPETGDVACGENGQGRFPAVERIVATVQGVVGAGRIWAGQRVLITSGPTREALDDVRYLSNRSSGKMGAALARAALLMGAEVVVVSGPVEVDYPREAHVVWVESAEQMLVAAQVEASHAALVIGAAAVADYRPAERVAGKLRRTPDGVTLQLVPNPDVLASLRTEGLKVGFAAEPSGDLEHARQKMARKGLVAVVHNDISRPGIGFGADENAVTLITGDAEIPFGPAPKLEVARWILEKLSHVARPV